MSVVPVSADQLDLSHSTPRSATPRPAVWALARIEAARQLRTIPVWLGLALSAYVAWISRDVDWQSGTYVQLAIATTPLAAGLFVAGVRSGGRDHHSDLPPLAEEAALGTAERVHARLLGMVPVVGIGVAAIAIAALAIRLEGGHWVGDWPGRTDSAVHTLPEVLQPMLVLVLAAALGVAAGRSVRRRAPIAVVGVVVLLAVGAIAWAWQGVPARYVTLVQLQPVEVQIGPASAGPASFPDDWLLSAPDEYDADWDRVIIHQPMAAWHDVYLGGLVLAAVAVALRGPAGRRLLAVGLAVAVLGVGAQIAVAPDAPVLVDPAAAVVR